MLLEAQSNRLTLTHTHLEFKCPLAVCVKLLQPEVDWGSLIQPEKFGVAIFGLVMVARFVFPKTLTWEEFIVI